ncbi:diguanylate cyclase [Paenibacillus sediminis]|uniref:Diguanylate cyclase (GGDEF)-like protein n=1 Tax=Paenibacillus sediminis TaxID=664909 RepID=A0ABS4GZ40_9BACL|nr:diguanylate cyclase [Paenibacillus sediminis]MBP1935543.1 diguanylate cyclase (GGDEF)-like protein [Paenibacillus sediminis]
MSNQPGIESVNRNDSAKTGQDHTVINYGEQSFWLQHLDITAFDFPYIELLLKQSFIEWHDEAIALPWMTRTQWSVYSSNGVKVIGDSNSANSENAGSGTSEAMSLCLAQQSPAVIVGSEHVNVGSHQQVSLAVPLFTRKNRELFAVLNCTTSLEQYHPDDLDLVLAAGLHFVSCFYRQFEFLFVSDLFHGQSQAEREARRRNILFEVVKRLHDKIDVDAVLTEVFDSIAEMYPTAHLELLMSQDHRTTNPKVKSLLFGQDRDDLCVRSFMEGRLITLENPPVMNEGPSYVEIAVPLSGKQGIYGVFHITLLKDFKEEIDLDLISVLSDTAGTAFENAKLYEQSNVLIHELRLINELTRRLNQSLKLKEIFQFSTQELLSIFQSDSCSILQYDKVKDCFEVMSSNIASIAKEVYATNDGFCGLIYESKEPVFLSDYDTYSTVTCRIMEQSNARSLIATPLIVNGEFIGIILITHQSPHFFSYDNYKLMQVLATHIGLAIANATLHAEVRRMANRDMLTGLYARRYLDEAIHEFQKTDPCGSLIVVDIDQFKQVNDTFGHLQGDIILKQVSHIIKTSVRSIDISARWGGEELAIYFPQYDVMQALQVAEKIRKRVEEETDPAVTVSCGIAEWSWFDDKVTVESLFYRADMALYKAKNNGRNQIQVEDVT